MGSAEWILFFLCLCAWLLLYLLNYEFSLFYSSDSLTYPITHSWLSKCVFSAGSVLECSFKGRKWCDVTRTGFWQQSTWYILATSDTFFSLCLIQIHRCFQRKFPKEECSGMHYGLPKKHSCAEGTADLHARTFRCVIIGIYTVF